MDEIFHLPQSCQSKDHSVPSQNIGSLFGPRDQHRQSKVATRHSVAVCGEAVNSEVTEEKRTINICQVLSSVGQ